MSVRLLLMSTKSMSKSDHPNSTTTANQGIDRIGDWSVRSSFIKTCVAVEISTHLQLPQLTAVLEARKVAITRVDGSPSRTLSFSADRTQMEIASLLNFSGPVFGTEFNNADLSAGSRGTWGFQWGDADRLGRKWGYCSIAGELISAKEAVDIVWQGQTWI